MCYTDIGMKWRMEDTLFQLEEAWRSHLVSRLHIKHIPHPAVPSSEAATAITWTCSSLLLWKASFNKRCISFFNSINKDLYNYILLFELNCYGCHFQIRGLAALTVNAWKLLFETLSSTPSCIGHAVSSSHKCLCPQGSSWCCPCRPIAGTVTIFK